MYIYLGWVCLSHQLIHRHRAKLGYCYDFSLQVYVHSWQSLRAKQYYVHTLTLHITCMCRSMASARSAMYAWWFQAWRRVCLEAPTFWGLSRLSKKEAQSSQTTVYTRMYCFYIIIPPPKICAWIWHLLFIVVIRLNSRERKVIIWLIPARKAVKLYSRQREVQPSSREKSDGIYTDLSFVIHRSWFV